MRDIIEARQPYLSVVMATRNDDHGGDPLRRLQAFITTFADQCRRFRLDAEVIVVEWNPPEDRPRVSSLCRVPVDAPFAVRFIEVPSERHQMLRFASVLPLFQMVAKNVGIRRARGRFIVATNIDIIFSNELVEHLAAGALVQGRLYRVDRHDIEPHYPMEATLAERMEYCRSHHLRMHTRLGTHPVDSVGRMIPLVPDILSTDIAFGSGWHVREGNAALGFYRWATSAATFTVDRRQGRERDAVLDIELEPNPFGADSWVELEILDHEEPLARVRVSRRMQLRVPLASGRSSHAITLRTRDSSSGRESLPLFEARRETCYRVYRVTLGPTADHEGDMSMWRRATNNNPLLVVSRTREGVDITSDPGSYSYCAQYGPFESPADQAYEFRLEYVPIAGKVQLKVIDDEQETWLPAQAFEVACGDARILGVSATIPRGTRFSLLVVNNVPGGGVSRCVLRRLMASVPLEPLRREAPQPSQRWAAALADYATRPFRRFRAGVTALERRRARRFHEVIAEESSRVRDLQARVKALEDLADLAPVARALRAHRPPPLFQNASGDFQLMAREHWIALRGYPEFETFSMGLDGLFESIAHASGLEEHLLEMPLCIYHLEHEKGSGWTPEGEADLRRRIDESGITWLDASTIHLWTMYMEWLRRPMIFNDGDWGLGGAELAEATVRPATYPAAAHATGDAG